MLDEYITKLHEYICKLSILKAFSQHTDHEERQIKALERAIEITQKDLETLGMDRRTMYTLIKEKAKEKGIL